MSNLKEVAKRAGVALGTASAVLNNKNWVSDELKKKVCEAAQELKYRPNRVAKNLKSRVTNTVGILVSHINSPFFSEIMKVLSYTCHKNGLNLFFSDTNCSEDIFIRSLNDFLEHKVDGIILLGIDFQEQLLKEILYDVDLPVISIEGYYNLENIANIQVDAFEGGYIATKHLLELDYFPVSIISGPLNLQDKIMGKNGWRRYEGYLKALGEKGVAYNNEYHYKGNFLFENGKEAFKYFSTLNPLPRAIFVSNDMMAIGTMEAIKRQGLRIPDDIAVVGFDDIPEASYVSPALTTVQLPKKRLGTLATEVLINYLKKKPDFPLKKVLPVKLIVRQSCGANLK